ncbi:MAG: hydrogenase maturation nickel metallochaperone HypA [Pseudonocardia sp.]|nr:hydrogenase maturation nickel metallochaperone HypA [Pseudonocardia sp.]
MHELSVTQGVVDAVVDALPGRRITRVDLDIGALSGVEPEALRFCFDLVTAGTGLEGAELVIAELPGRAHCEDCGSDFVLDTCILLCRCGSADVRVRSGQELQIRSVRVA